MSWENNAYAPSKENVRTALAIQSLARDPFGQMGVPSNVEGVIGSYLFQNAPGQNLRLASRNILRNARTARRARRARNQRNKELNLGQSYLVDPRIALPPEAYMIPEPVVAPVALRTAGPFTPPPSPTASELRAEAALRNLAAQQKSRRRRGKMELPVNFAALAPFGRRGTEKAKGKGKGKKNGSSRRRSRR